jgi:hypothetical protein
MLSPDRWLRIFAIALMPAPIISLIFASAIHATYFQPFSPRAFRWLPDAAFAITAISARQSADAAISAPLAITIA